MMIPAGNNVQRKILVSQKKEKREQKEESEVFVLGLSVFEGYEFGSFPFLSLLTFSLLSFVQSSNCLLPHPLLGNLLFPIFNILTPQDNWSPRRSEGKSQRNWFKATVSFASFQDFEDSMSLQSLLLSTCFLDLKSTMGRDNFLIPKFHFLLPQLYLTEKSNGSINKQLISWWADILSNQAETKQTSYYLIPREDPNSFNFLFSSWRAQRRS